MRRGPLSKSLLKVFSDVSPRPLLRCLEYTPMLNNKQLTHEIIGAAIEVHKVLGPGLLESAYEVCLAQELTLRDIKFEKQKPLPVVYKDTKLEEGYRLDLLVEGKIVVELKAVEKLTPIHDAIMLTYLRLSECKIGLLINFNVPVLKDGLRRFVWHYNENEP
jgi:GxxExxY protein